MLETKEHHAKPSSTANWCTSTKVNTLNKFIFAQDLINMGMLLPLTHHPIQFSMQLYQMSEMQLYFILICFCIFIPAT